MRNNRYYGISKGSKTFPFRELFNDPDAITIFEAQIEYDFLAKRRLRMVRVIAKWAEDNHIDSLHITDIPEDIMSVKCQITNIDNRLMSLIEQFPEVER